MPYKDLEKKRQQGREWAAKRRITHPNEAKERQQRWRDNHPGSGAAYYAKLKEENPEYLKKLARDSHQQLMADPVRLERKRQYAKNRQRIVREDDPFKEVDAKLRSQYGIDLNQFEELERRQEFSCAICKQPERRAQKGKLYRLSVDHCHETGFIRGLLCSPCNLALGRFKTPELLQAALSYLINPPAKNIPPTLGLKE